MMNQDFRAWTFHEDGATVVGLAGEVDMGNAADLRAALDRAAESAPVTLVLDLSELEFMDSTAVGVMVRTGNSLRAAGAAICIRRPRPHIRKVLDIMGLGEFFALEG